MQVLKGTLKIGALIETPKYVLGKVTSIQKDKKDIDRATPSDKVCIKIESIDQKFTYGKHFTAVDSLKSVVSKKEMSTLKMYFRPKS